MREFVLMLGFGLLGIALGTGASMWQFSKYPVPRDDQLGAVSFPIKAFHDMSTEPPRYLSFPAWSELHAVNVSSAVRVTTELGTCAIGNPTIFVPCDVADEALKMLARRPDRSLP